MSQQPELQLAKILEKAWLRFSSSRLSLPFLRPLLPLVDRPPGEDVRLMDIIDISDKIRSLEYKSADSFLNDLDMLRTQVIHKLERILDLRFDSEQSIFFPVSAPANAAAIVGACPRFIPLQV